MDTYHPVGTFHKRNVTTNILLTNKPAAIACDKSGKIIGVIFVFIGMLFKQLLSLSLSELKLTITTVNSIYSTVTDLARFLGLSISQPLSNAT